MFLFCETAQVKYLLRQKENFLPLRGRRSCHTKQPQSGSGNIQAAVHTAAWQRSTDHSAADLSYPQIYYIYFVLL